MRSKVEGVQNVQVSKPIPAELTFQQQLDLMEQYTKTHQKYSTEDKAIREIECLKVLYPTLFRKVEAGDKIVGRLDFLPIGFGSVTSVGGVSHYCVFHKLTEFKQNFSNPEDLKRIDTLYDYWLEHDTKALFINQEVDEVITTRFIDGRAPLMATARLSGLMLNYHKLMEYGLDGLKEQMDRNANSFMDASYQSIELLQTVIQHYIDTIEDPQQIEVLKHIKHQPPQTFVQALQLFWMYALIAGVINYGRMDDVLGTYLKQDIDQGRLSKDEAIAYIKSLWMLIENRRTTVNGRIIVGGQGRKDPEAADLFTRYALEVCHEMRTVEPQFTLRFDSTTPEDIMQKAYDCIASGATYPTLYNDEVNVPAVEYAMRVPKKVAQHYVPFGCGEFVIQGKSLGTPNILLNLVKIMQIALNEGKDPMDGIQKNGPVEVKPLSSFKTFDDFYDQYKQLLDYYFDLSVEKQLKSYEIMNQEASFLFSSILMDDCLERQKSILDGGIEILGGTNETYGNINASDALYVIKHFVYDTKKYSFEELNQAALNNYQENPRLRELIWNLPKYGNDHDEVDALANDLFEYVAKGIRDRGIEHGMDYFLIVISNNQTNTDWGKETDASLDGRYRGQFMNPANNPQGGASRKGPTAVLNSLAKFDAKYHGGSVQNIKFTPRMMKADREKVQYLFKVYFKQGGPQLMVTVVDHQALEDAQKNPQNYPDLIVRVAGYSARFIDLSKDIQDELLSRVLYD